MLRRKIATDIELFFKSQQKALLITGARQTGKTFIVREHARRMGMNLVEINFLENQNAMQLFSGAADTKAILLRISALTDVPLEEGKTIIFFDEVQENKEIVTAIKFLVEDGRFQYILSGSLLGIELRDIRSLPVGYMDIMEMYPLDFEEFCFANKVSQNVIGELKKCFMEKKPVDSLIHEKMMELFRLYLIVGGMPEAVNTYLKTNDLRAVEEIQKGIIRLYKKDISKYDPDHKLYLDEIFDLIPSELNSKNKRFILKKLNENFKFSRYEHSFIWLKDAGVALPVYSAAEPTVPLLLSKATNLFKLFSSDTGLLSAMYMNGLQLKILSKEKDINFGSVYENVVAQELKAHGFDLYFYANKKMGELDFLIEKGDEIIPLEIKSGKGYMRHAALQNVLAVDEYHISNAYVFCNDNVKCVEQICYYPVYMIMFLKKEERSEKLIYTPDFSALM